VHESIKIIFELKPKPYLFSKLSRLFEKKLVYNIHENKEMLSVLEEVAPSPTKLLILGYIAKDQNEHHRGQCPDALEIL
jgi:hypothetical protein